ncbi:MAG: hypothetical protein PHV59_10010 [Victivallales bacterium]|nr:hypothetical protein [Victivallales bacterium]
MNPDIDKKAAFAWIPGFIRNDWLRKVIALFFAILFYLTFTSRL